ncbi:hypothetical protein [Paenibacillus sp. AN1007]|uniref:PqqD family protein n=1 Tax=Paenibacillus sp. AN1007 TaxID=3151385 RepID=A0AAU8NBQ4_9BACL
MDNLFVSIAKGVEVKSLYDGKSAFVFKEAPISVSLIGSLPLAVFTFIDREKRCTIEHIRTSLMKMAKLDNVQKKLQFDNAILCAIGQLQEQKILSVSSV